MEDFLEPDLGEFKLENDTLSMSTPADKTSTEFKLTWYDEKRLKKVINKGKKIKMVKLPTEDEIFSMLLSLDEPDDCDRFDKIYRDVSLTDADKINDFLKKLIGSNIVEDMNLIDDLILKFKDTKMKGTMSEICEVRRECIKMIRSHIDKHIKTIDEAIDICKMIYANYPRTQINTVISLSTSNMDMMNNYIPNNLEYENMIIDIENAHFVFAKIVIEYHGFYENPALRHWKELEEIDFVNC